MRLIDADALNDSMYHEAFETDSELQKWDSGCWIRYKMFENHLDMAPTADAVPVVRCGECSHYNISGCSEGFGWCEKIDRGVTDGHFCSYGEKWRTSNED